MDLIFFKLIFILNFIQKCHSSSFTIFENKKVKFLPIKTIFVYDKITCLAYCSKFCSDDINLGLSGCSIKEITNSLVECNLYSKFLITDLIQDDNYRTFKMQSKCN